MSTEELIGTVPSHVLDEFTAPDLLIVSPPC